MKRARLLIVVFALLSILLLLAWHFSGAGNRYEVRPSADGYDVLKAGRIVGTVTRYEIPPLKEGEKRYPIIIQQLGIFNLEDSKADYCMLGSSLYSDWNLTYGMNGEDFSHEFFVYDTYLYDLWINLSCLEPDEGEKIAAFFADNVLPELP